MSAEIHQNSSNSKIDPKFILYWSGQQVSLLGSEIVAFIIIWWITVETGNPLFLSLVMFFNLLPRLLFSSVAGMMADKKDKKTILIVADLGQAVTTLLLIGLICFIELSVVILLIAVFIRSSFQAFQLPTVGALISDQIPKNKISQFSGINQFFEVIILMISPIFGAILYDLFPISQNLWIDIITFIIALITIIPLKIFNKIPEKVTDENKPLQKFKFTEGMKIINEIPGMMGIIIISFTVNLFLGPFNTMVNYLIYDFHQGTSTDLAIVSVGFQIGMLIGSILFSVKKKWKNLPNLMIGSILLLFSGLILFSIVPKGNIILLAVIGGLSCLGIPLMSSTMQTIILTKISTDKMGRAISIFQFAGSIAMLAGYLLSGPLTQIFGIIEIFIACSIIGSILILLIGYFFKIRKLFSEKDNIIADSEGIHEPIKL